MKEWQNFLKDREKQFGKNTVDKWLRSLKIVTFDACNIYLQATDSFQISWFEEHISPFLKEFKNSNGHLIEVHFQPHLPSAHNEQPKNDPSFSFTFDPLDPTCHFESFLESEENEKTLQILKEILPHSKEEKSTFNPIYLYGKSGAGKTHLIMATAHFLQTQGMKVCYVKSETFTSHVVSAIRFGQMKEFRSTYRNVDALLIDDVHLFSNKTATGEELFHTFNDFYAKGKPIILTSNSLPSSLELIEERLTSRFEWGILLKIHPLKAFDLHRLAKQKCKELDLNLKEEAFELIASQFSTSHTMLTALNLLVLRKHLSFKKEIIFTKEQIEEILKEFIANETKKKLTFDVIIDKVSQIFGVPPQEILGKSQSRESTLPRQISMYFCREYLKLSYPQIGKLFSRDHSTVMTSVKRIQEGLSERNEEILISFLDIEKKLQTFLKNSTK